MAKARVIVLLLFGATAIAGGGAFYARDPEAARALLKQAATELPWTRPEAPRSEMVLYGNVDVRQVDLAFNVPGRIEQMLAEEGDEVAPSALLAALEAERYLSQVEGVRARLERQRAILAALEAGSRREEIERARAEVAAAEAALNLARETYERRAALARTDIVSAQALDDSREARDRATANLKAAQEALTLARKGPRKEDIEAARAEARAIEADLALAQQDLADTEVRAPAAGTVLVRIQEPGAIMRAGEPVYTLALATPVWVRAYVSEPDLGRIHPGMSVLVVTDSRPDRPYRGQVGFISPAAEFTPKTVQTPDLRTSLVYRIRVVVENPDRGLRQGMPVTLRIPLAGPPATAARG
ncbi:MAG: efflux RND transporter periplasmic adaptor subunit [Proteobacteria bacterium]|nr:efflux RND transporter periplasmic adaptor subunit [Pseudomonadota bacterium]